MRLSELATTIRTKNAGPCMLTIDILFPDAESFGRVVARIPELTGFVMRQYSLREASLKVFVYPPAHAIKLTLPRQIVSGSVGDTDVYGAQQHQPMLDFEV